MFHDNFSDIIEEDKSQFEQTCKENLWDLYYTKYNFPQHFSVSKNWFKSGSNYFKVFSEDYRDGINLREFFVFRIMKSMNPNTIFHKLVNWMVCTRYTNYRPFYKISEKLELRGYIKVNRNWDTKEIHLKPKDFKLSTKIECFNPLGEKINLTKKERKQRYAKIMERRKIK